jgi:hypothetical protein
VVLVNPPAGYPAALDPLPDGVCFEAPDADSLDVIVFFTAARAELAARFVALGQSLQPAGGLWIAWPKKASKVPTDLTEDVLREVGLPTGMVDNKVCAIDETWSGLRFVRRKELRP